MAQYPYIPFRPTRYPTDDLLGRGRGFCERMNARRSVRCFSPDPVSREAIELAIQTAGTAGGRSNRPTARFPQMLEVRLSILEVVTGTGPATRSVCSVRESVVHG